MNKFKIVIDRRLDERTFFETCLNMKYSGVAMNYLRFSIAIYFLANQTPNALYYFDLLENI